MEAYEASEPAGPSLAGAEELSRRTVRNAGRTALRTFARMAEHRERDGAPLPPARIAAMRESGLIADLWARDLAASDDVEWGNPGAPPPTLPQPRGPVSAAARAILAQTLLALSGRRRAPGDPEEERASLFLRRAAFAAGGEGTPDDLCARTVQALDGAEAAAAAALGARS